MSVTLFNIEEGGDDWERYLEGMAFGNLKERR